jgi:hypothetical protein
MALQMCAATSAANFVLMWAKFQRLEMGWNNIAGPQRYFQLSKQILVKKNYFINDSRREIWGRYAKIITQFTSRAIEA